MPDLPGEVAPSAELGSFLQKHDTVPSLVMERLKDIRDISTKLRALKIFSDGVDPSELEFKPDDPPIIQVLRQLAVTFHMTRSETVRREILSEVRETLDMQSRRELEAMKECTKLMVTLARLAKSSKGATTEDELMKLIGGGDD